MIFFELWHNVYKNQIQFMINEGSWNEIGSVFHKEFILIGESYIFASNSFKNFGRHSSANEFLERCKKDF